ncbi:hypothetical protein N7528_002697 [Penicillium herquei]|nr:hypothetical protein N7528_002697 [Penicillium herquei]
MTDLAPTPVKLPMSNVGKAGVGMNSNGSWVGDIYQNFWKTVGMMALMTVFYAIYTWIAYLKEVNCEIQKAKTSKLVEQLQNELKLEILLRETAEARAKDAEEHANRCGAIIWLLYLYTTQPSAFQRPATTTTTSPQDTAAQMAKTRMTTIREMVERKFKKVVGHQRGRTDEMEAGGPAFDMESMD